MEKARQDWMIAKIAEMEARYDFTALPVSIEAEAVRSLYQQFKSLFCRKRDIRARIKASQAISFDNLKEAIATK